MELRQLNCFLVLADELHFGRAAQRLHMSQPPLSRLIQQMEEDLGVSLFERTKRSVLLTPAGDELLQNARQMVLQMETVRKRLSEFGKGEAGLLKLGYVGAVMHSELPALLAGFSQKMPSLRLHFEELPNEALVHGLTNGTLDAAFVRTYLHADHLEERLILKEPFVAVVPLKHPLAARKSVSMRQLTKETFITFTRECGPTIFDSFLVLCTNAGFSPHIVHHASQLNSVIRLVESGFGISLLPGNISKGYVARVKYLPITDSSESVPLLMLTRKKNSNPALLALHKYIASTSTGE